MAIMKTIAVVGATGNMGSAIVRGLAKGPYRLLLMGNQEEKLQQLKNAIEIEFPQSEVDNINCPKEASWESDIIIIATPYSAEKEVAEKIREVATGKIVISISNPLNESFDDLVIAPDTSAAEQLQALLPFSKVVKAFNTTFAGDFSNPVINGKVADAFIAGDDEEAIESVSELVKTAGFNPVFAGSLVASRTLERMQLLLIQMAMKNNNWMAGWKILYN